MESRRSSGGLKKTSAHEKAKASEKFAVFWHEECFMHRIKDHPEQPDRVSAILIALRKIYPEDCFRKAPLVTNDRILLFHTASHLQDLIKLCDKTEKAYDENDDEELYQSIDGDTVVMWKTRRAVWRAAGSVVSAIDNLYLQPGNSRYIRYLFQKITVEVKFNSFIEKLLPHFVASRSVFYTKCQETMCHLSILIISHSFFHVVISFFYFFAPFQ
jgi:Histone deacetylase domain